MDDDIPPELLDQIGAGDNPGTGGGGGSGGGGGGGPGGMRECPHCTFENWHGGSDCEVCGLPL